MLTSEGTHQKGRAMYVWESKTKRPPGYMTHAELKRELATAMGGRRDELVKEAQIRMRSRTYPRFPADLVPVPKK